MSATVYSQRLGAISDAQLAAAASRLDLGAFVSATPASSGMHGQNLFLTTEAGDFVLRGAPHWMGGLEDPGYQRGKHHQFTKEAFFAVQLHEHTRAPAPWPYLFDEASDIFGWPYVIMPRMPGACFTERSILKALGPDDRCAVAAAAGAMIAEMQRLTSPFSGDFDPVTIRLTADPSGNTERMVAHTRRLAEAAEGKAVLTADDADWIEVAFRGARAAGDRPVTFAHGDYKLDNMTVVQEAGVWRVGGVFDLQTARFGDGAYDLVHQACGYLDTEPPGMARVFIDAWRAAASGDVDVAAWMPLYVVSNRLMLWQAFAQPGQAPIWSRGRTFRAWAEPYLSQMLSLL